VTAGPKPPPGGLVSTFRVRVVMPAQAMTKVPAESATTRPPKKRLITDDIVAVLEGSENQFARPIADAWRRIYAFNTLGY
jgi:hypothetical protein